MATRNIVPRATGEGSIGTAAKHWGAGHFDTLPNWQEYLAESTGYGIVSGCEPSISGLTVTVGTGVVHLADGTRKELSATNITLDSADSTNPRIDLVYINADGEVAKVTGTASASPSAPVLPSNGIKVCVVTVAANASTGTVNRVQTIAPNLTNYGVINVMDFGAKGDGVTDDTAAIQAAIDNNPKSVILFPPGKYLITSSINVISPIIGSGYIRNHTNLNIGTWIINRVPQNEFAFVITNQSQSNVFMSNLNIYCHGNGGINTNLNRYDLLHFEKICVANVSNYGLYIANSIGSSREVFLREITIFGSLETGVYTESVGIYLDNHGYDSRITNVEIMGVQRGIAATGVLYGSNWHIWTGDMIGKSNNQWWLDTAGIVMEGPYLAVNNLYLDTARTGIITNGGHVNISNFIWMNDENLIADDTSPISDGIIMWNALDNNNKPVTGAIINCSLHLSNHANLPFNGEWTQTTKVDDVAVVFANGKNYESFALSHAGIVDPASLPNSRIYDVRYVYNFVPLNSANMIQIGKVACNPGVYGICEMQIQADSAYKGNLYIKFDNGMYADSKIDTIMGADFKFFISSLTNGIATVYMKYPTYFPPGNVYGQIRCPKSKNVGFLDLNATFDGNKYDFTTDITDISTLTELGV